MNDFQKSQSEKIRAMYGEVPTEKIIEKSEEELEFEEEKEPTFEDLEDLDNLEKED